jgi:hypothetical protein
MAWSFSQLQGFETCPRQFFELKIARNYQQILHPTTAWGTRGHLALEERVRDGKELPSEFSYLEGFAQGVIAIPGETHCEYEIACTKELTPTAFDAPDAWCRGIIDLLKVNGDSAIALDYKFGKVKPSAQLKLMALLVFVNFPEVQRVQSRFLWIQFRDTTKGEFLREDAERIWPEFENRAAQLALAHEEGYWVEKPSGLCRAHCPCANCDFYQKGNKRW